MTYTYEVPRPGLIEGPSRILAILRDLDTIWGHARIGLCLADAFVHNVTRTSDEIARNCVLHRDTVRRHLSELEKAGRVIVEKKGRSVCYRAHPEWAAKTIEKMVGLADWAVENINAE